MLHCVLGQREVTVEQFRYMRDSNYDAKSHIQKMLLPLPPRRFHLSRFQDFSQDVFLHFRCLARLAASVLFIRFLTFHSPV